MSVKIVDNTASIESNIQQKASIFLRTMADEIVSISSPRTPMKSGHLRREILKQVLGLRGTVKWSVNYAIYQEEKQFKNYTVAGTGPHFAENAVMAAIENTDTIARRTF